MDYFEVRFSLFEYDPVIELLKQDLCDLGFDSFVDGDNLISAFVPENYFSKIELNLLIAPYSKFIKSFNTIKHPYQNWNSLWESNFEPIQINENCVIKASFHTSNNLPYEIIIDPKMSFGTGHHQTTRLIARDLFQQNVEGKRVLDFGSGTGVLSILAEKLNAKSIDAIEIDNMAVNNAKANAKKNNCNRIQFYNGDGASIPKMAYDLILININKNTIIDQFKYVKSILKKNTVILFSGFFSDDIASIEDLGQLNGLITLYSSLENNWALLVMKYK